MGDAQREPSDHVNLPRRTKRHIGLSRAVLIFELFWNALWPALVPIALALIASLFGLWAHVPGALHWPLIALVLATALFVYVRDLRAGRWPSRDDAIARLDDDSPVAGRPLTSYTDSLAGEGDGISPSEKTQEIWKAHRTLLRDQLAKLSTRPPASDLPRKDPRAMRVLLALALIIGMIAAGPEAPNRLLAMVAPGSLQTGDSAATTTAWIAPPDYTRLAPIYLSADEESAKEEITVPAGSTFFVRVQNEKSAPHIEHLRPAAGAGATQRPPEPIGFDEIDDQIFEYSATLMESATLKISHRRREIAAWHVRVVPDRAPVIGFTQDPEPSRSRSLTIPYAIWDDYGVVSAKATIARNAVELPEFDEPSLEDEPLLGEDAETVTAPDALDEEEDDLSFDITHIWRNEPLTIDIPLKQLITQRTEAKHVEHLLAHPWAGSEIDITLSATDQKNQMGESETLTVTLPARDFLNPLARAIIEQRQVLAFAPKETTRVAETIDALTRFPERYIKDSTVYLSLRTASRRLKSVDSIADLEDISSLLWDTALHIEDGDRAEIAKRISRLKQKLDKALADNRPQDEIDKIMQALRDAINEYIRDLAQNGEPQEAEPGAPTISSNDINDLMQAIEDMLRTGNMEGAERLLAELMDMMESLEMVSPGPGQGMGPGESAMEEALGDLGNIIGKQRNLLDETFRREQNPESSQPGEEGAGIAQEQEALRESLDDIIGQLEDNGVELPQELERAEKAMRGSRDSLELNDPSGALPQQEEAIDQLREGAQSLAEQLMEQLDQRFSENGRKGRGRPTQEYDPLGRPNRSAGPEFGDNVKVPEERDLQRARRILEELRRRSAERHRPEKELDYLERLLPRF